MRVREDQIGGGVVARSFTSGQKKLPMGHRLSREEVLSIPLANRNSLIENRFLQVLFRDPGATAVAASSADQMTRYAVHQGRGRYDVIEGRKLNTEPLTEAQAKDLAAKGTKKSKAN